MKKTKKESLGFSRTVDNNLYILKMLHRASPGRIACEIALSAVSSFAAFVSGTWLLRYIVNSASAGEPFGKILPTALLILAAGLILNGILPGVYGDLISPLMKLRSDEYMSKLMFKKAGEVELSCYEDPEFYDKYVKAFREAGERSESVVGTITKLIGSIIAFSANSFLIFSIDPLLMLFTLVPLIIYFIFGKSRKKIGYESEMRQTEVGRRSDYTQRTFYIADYAKEMRLTEIWRVMLQKFDTAIDDTLKIIRKYGLTAAALAYAVNVLRDILVTLGATLYSCYRTLISGKMLYGDCVIVLSSISQVSGVLEEASEIVLTFSQHALFIENLRAFLDYEPKIKENPEGLSPPADRFDIEMKNISFTYKGAASPALKNVSVRVGRGEKIALVGENGAGKTTLVKLLLRMYEPESGEITINGREVSEYTLSGYRASIGTVFQDYRVFSATVAENVLTRRYEESDREKVISALCAAGVYEKIRGLKNGIFTPLTREFDDNGTILSGGEAQKVAIARVFAAGCPCVVLDEPSSALDPIAEYKMYESISASLGQSAVIFISHRLSSAVLADRIYMLEDGEIIEHGSHAELMRTGGKYADMFEKQAKSYRNEEDAYE